MLKTMTLFSSENNSGSDVESIRHFSKIANRDYDLHCTLLLSMYSLL